MSDPPECWPARSYELAWVQGETSGNVLAAARVDHRRDPRSQSLGQLVPCVDNRGEAWVSTGPRLYG